MRIKRFNEDFELSMDFGSIIGGFLIWAKISDKDGMGRQTERTGWITQPGHYSFFGVYQDPKQGTLYDTEKEAQEYLDKVERKPLEYKIVPAGEVLTSIFQVTTGNCVDDYCPLVAKAIVLSKEKAKDVLKGRRYERDGNVEYLPWNHINSTEGPYFDVYDKAKEFIINKLSKDIKDLQENIKSVKEADIDDSASLGYDERYFDFGGDVNL